MSADERGAVIRPVLLGCTELREARACESAETFGETGASWSTVVGITLGDADRIVNAKGWWVGSGNWAAGRTPQSAPLSLEVYLYVTSGNTPIGLWPEWLQPHQALSLPQFKLAAVDAYIETVIGAVSSAPWDDVVTQLKPYFHIETLD